MTITLEGSAVNSLKSLIELEKGFPFQDAVEQHFTVQQHPLEIQSCFTVLPFSSSILSFKGERMHITID